MSLVNLREYVDPTSINALNVNEDESNVKDLLGRAQSDGKLESDVDEQLIMSVGFQQSCRVHSIILGYENGDKSYAPKKIKVFINSPEIDFDKANEEDEMPKGNAVGVITLNDSQSEGQEPIFLKFVRLQRVNSIQIFIASNKGDEGVTKIDKFILVGDSDSGRSTNMSDFGREE